LLIAVDHWRGNPTEINEAHAFAKSGDVRGEFVKNLRDFLHLIVMDTDSETSASLVNGPFDAVFIDGEHTFEACYADLQAWEKHVRLGGSLCGHDRLLKGVPDALSKFFGSVPKPFENTGLWELVKIEGGWRDAFAG
jgi:predicted O-methyltransferase YrrM